ncbi:MAG: hypothetical protein HMLKMBBP_03123 [Planctomycetes bacterium]|nr:hypothetical protein [Planctomycetota bacterium]
MVPKRLLVHEYKATSFATSDVTEEAALAILQHHSDKLSIEWPSPTTSERWRITSAGWVGYLPVDDTHLVELKPRATLSSLFGMLEYAYRLKSLQWPGGSADCDSLAEFYERLAAVLAKLVMDRLRRGLQRSYVGIHEELACVRGRIDIPVLSRAPWRPELPCQFEEHTTDIPDNAIVLWTLDRILRSGLCTEKALPIVRTAHRRLSGCVAVRPFTGEDCRDREYSRLNSDYEAMHWLCRFFLENSGPAHTRGDHRMLPFLVHMPGLFETFVAAWLAQHAADRYRVDRQYRLLLPGSAELRMVVDIVLRDPRTDRVLAVLDTKYKLHESPAPADAAQVVAYAQALHCRAALLVYPNDVKSLHADFADISVRSVSFDIARPLDESGWEFLASIERAVAAARAN